MKSLGLGFDQEFKNNLTDNFNELNANTNYNGTTFATLGDRLNAIEKGLVDAGIDIDGKDEDE